MRCARRSKRARGTSAPWCTAACRPRRARTKPSSSTTPPAASTCSWRPTPSAWASTCTACGKAQSASHGPLLRRQAAVVRGWGARYRPQEHPPHRVLVAAQVQWRQRRAAHCGADQADRRARRPLQQPLPRRLGHLVRHALVQLSQRTWRVLMCRIQFGRVLRVSLSPADMPYLRRAMKKPVPAIQVRARGGGLG